MLDALHSAAFTARSPRRPIWEREQDVDFAPLGTLDGLSDDADSDLDGFREQRRRRVVEENEH